MAAALMAMAQRMTVEVNPQTPSAGEPFVVTYVVENAGGNGNLSLGSNFNGLRVLGGPSKGSSQSISVVNDKMTKKSSVTFTFYVEAPKAGTYQIPSATYSGAKPLKTTGKTIRVTDQASEPDPTTPQGMMRQMQQIQQQMQQHMANIDRLQGRVNPSRQDVPEGKRIFLKASVNKTTAYEQEAIVLTYKLYTITQSIRLLRNINPKFDNFNYKQMELEGRNNLTPEAYGGYNYLTTILYQYVLFPQKSGRLVIPSLDAEFGVSMGFDDDIVQAKSDSLVLNIKALPERPANFIGAVGHDFTVSAKLDANEVAANDALLYGVTVTGTGNLHLMKAPQLTWPKGFESYDAKKKDQTEITTEGYQGNMTFEYVAVPHDEGKYTIPATTFSYFDTTVDAYRTLTIPAKTVTITPSKGGSHGSDDVAEKTDIQPIRLGSYSYHDGTADFWGSMAYLMAHLLVVLMTLLVLWGGPRYMRVSSDMSRKAGKTATKRLREAERLRRLHKKDEFYDEVMRALLGFASDKLRITTLELTKDNLSEQMLAHGVDQGLVDKYLGVVEQCEYARFAPGDAALTIKKVYNEAFESIVQLDAKL